jgi:hypothetical protein
MPRKARIDLCGVASAKMCAPGVLRHIIVRGIDRRKIFFDDPDRDVFLDRLGGILSDTDTACFAWAFMTNHLDYPFGGRIPEARRLYLEYVKKGVSAGRRPDLTGGGLVRSAGGWCALRTMRKGESRMMGDAGA